MQIKQLKTLFLIDGLGALLSAFLLGVVLVNLESYFGIPHPALYFLASLPCFFAAYDFYCYFKVTAKLGTHLKRIAILNLLYCALSFGVALYHIQEVKQFGWVYIICEIIIVVALAAFELKSANRDIRKRT